MVIHAGSRSSRVLPLTRLASPLLWAVALFVVASAAADTIANTDITLGLYEGSTLRATWRLSSDAARTEDEYGLHLRALVGQVGQTAPAGLSQATDAIIASVAPGLTPVWQGVCRQVLGVEALVVGAGLRTGLRIRTENPRQLGADRVANAVAAKDLFGGWQAAVQQVLYQPKQG